MSYKILTINNQNLDQEINLFNRLVISTKERFKYKSFWYKDENLNIFTSLLDKSASLLTQNGLKINKNVFLIDFHIYNLKNDKYETDLTWHQDDYGGIDEKVNTIIYYLQKDDSINKGNLLYLDKNKKINEIKIESNQIVMMDGRLEHKPDNLEGTGFRKSIVIQFKRID